MLSDIHTDPKLQAASMNHLITAAENRRVQNPINLGQDQHMDLTRGPQLHPQIWTDPQWHWASPLCQLKQQRVKAESEGGEMQIHEEPALLR